MTNEVKNVPELRFPGYNDEWKEKKLEESLQERKTIQKVTDEIPLLAFASGQGVIDRSERKTNNRDFLTKDANQKRYLLTKKNDIVYNPSNLKYGAIDRNKKGTGVISPIYVTFESIEDPSFMELIVKSYKFQQLALRFEEGTVTKRQSVKPEYLLTVLINVPQKSEQKKIGDFFSKLDQQIELEEKKLAKLEEQKKGYMQQIFSRQFLFENEKGDMDYSWRNFKIKDIFSKIESGNRLPKTNLVEGNIPYVIAQTTNNGVFMHISEDTLDYHKNKLKLFKKGSITISIDNPEAMFIQEMDFFTSNVMRVIHNENLKRGSHIFIMESLKKLTQSYNWSVKFSGPIIMDSTVKFPVYNDNKVNWNVVNKIGDFFNTFEIRINRQSDKIKLLEERKKGFLQKMFI